VLIAAMKAVCNAELFIAGCGNLEVKLKKRVRRAGLCASVHFLGTLSRGELLAAFYDCDIFVFPSVANSEAFGICQLEAMYYGKPVINTYLPTAVPTVSLHGVTGLTVPPGDVSALANAINTLVKDEALRCAYGEAAARRVKEKYDRTQMIEAVYQCWKE
jgi:rhamnosyl/mannosyltransferase